MRHLDKSKRRDRGDIGSLFFVESTDVVANHTGARGLAEAPIIPTAPAIANAVADALGVEIAEIPLTPWRVLASLRPT
jgi:CO/xanthine dehydrogenase Mo-binding subunit